MADEKITIKLQKSIKVDIRSGYDHEVDKAVNGVLLNLQMEREIKPGDIKVKQPVIYGNSTAYITIEYLDRDFKVEDD